jgi:hypothetical protein
MKKWILTLICLGYLTPSFATQHDSFLVSGDDINEVALYDHGLETPNFFTRIFPLNMNPDLVLIPRTNSGFMFGVTGYAQRAHDNQLDYVIIDPNSSAFLVGPNSTIHAVEDPGYEFGYGAYIGYIFPYTGRDLKLDLSYFNVNTTNRTIAPQGGVLWTPITLYDQTIQALTATTTYKPQIANAFLAGLAFVFTLPWA